MEIELTGLLPRTIRVAVDGRAARGGRLRGRAAPTTTIRMDGLQFTRLCGGRPMFDALPPDIEFDGDAEVGQRIVEHLNYVIPVSSHCRARSPTHASALIGSSGDSRPAPVRRYRRRPAAPGRREPDRAVPPPAEDPGGRVGSRGTNCGATRRSRRPLRRRARLNPYQPSPYFGDPPQRRVTVAAQNHRDTCRFRRGLGFTRTLSKSANSPWERCDIAAPQPDGSRPTYSAVRAASALERHPEGVEFLPGPADSHPE